jgi:diguanylate cyclase (GGDEF)-like protein/PAS domain S-box-containing protein
VVIMRWWLEAATGFVVINVLHLAGLAVPGNIWVFNAILIIATALAQTKRPAGAKWARIAMPVGLTGMLAYLSGWGPLLAVAFVVASSALLQDLGARHWRRVMILSVLAIATGQGAVALGWLPSYLPQSAAQAIGLISLGSTSTGIRLLGKAMAAREQAEETARRNEDRFRALVQDSADVIAITDLTGKVTYVSAAVEHVMGLTVDEFMNTPGRELVHPDDYPEASAMGLALAKGTGHYHTELRFRHGDGTWRWHEVFARNLAEHPAVAGIVYNHRDITERKQYQERLAHEVAHDPLTGLVNGATFRTKLDERRGGAVLYLDLDGFKQINDEYGHDAGDALLTATARVIRECVRDADTVARLGGDEFAVLLGDAGSAESVAARILDRLGEPVLIAGHQVRARASIGIAVGEPGEAAREILHRADEAMYRAKRSGKHRWELSTGLAARA